MKVAVIIDTWFPFIGGGQINALEISKRLAKKGVKIDIITRNNGKENLKGTTNLKIYKIGSKSDPNSLISKILFSLRSFFFIATHSYDVVHAHAFLPGTTARLLMITKGIPAILTVHGTSVNTQLNNFFSKLLEKFILNQILYSAQITVSRDFLKINNINKNVQYIPNGVEVNKFDKISANKYKNFTLIFVGRLHPQKNLIKLIEAIKNVLESFPKMSLIIVGEGTEKEALVTKVKDLNLSKNIVFTGNKIKKELITLYKRSHIFILPSIYEGQPLTLLEAWAAKIPVIVTKTGDCQYLIRNNQNGYLINDPSSKDEIADKIIEAYKNNNLEKLGQNGYNLVKGRFNWDKSAEQTLKVYEKAIKSSKN